MKWFKCLSPNDPLYTRAKMALGKQGAYEILESVYEAINLELDALDAACISNYANVRIDRAERLLPFANEVYQRTKIIYALSSDKSDYLGISSDISKDRIDVDPSNPRGSIKDREKDKKDYRDTIKKLDKKRHVLPEDWIPDQDLLNWAKEKHPGVDPTTQTERFKLHYLANGGLMKDWRRCWQSWIARSKEFGGQSVMRFSAVSVPPIKRQEGTGKL